MGVGGGLSELCAVIVPRERLTPTAAAAERLVDELAGTGARVVVVAHERAPPSARVRGAAHATLIEVNRFVMPWESKSIALSSPWVSAARYVAFIDNDVELAAGSLSLLIEALVDTGAALAHPLVLHREAGRTRIHIARGLFTGAAPAHVPTMEHLGEPPGRSVGGRAVDDYAELHAIVVDRRALAAITPFTPVAVAEELDVSLRVRAAGLDIVFEPGARATYVVDPPRSTLDGEFFRFRWADERARADVDLLRPRWPIAAPYWAAKLAWLPRHRRLATPLYAAAERVVRGVRALRWSP